jgi:ferredoxin
MRITVDHDICTGHGRCATVAPDVYSLDDAGFCAVTTLEVGPELAAAARAGANNCPERAITVED